VKNLQFVLAKTSQLSKCCVCWVSVALVVVSDAGWRQENLGSVLSGTILFLDRNQLSVEWLLGLKQLMLRMHGASPPFPHILWIVSCPLITGTNLS